MYEITISNVVNTINRLFNEVITVNIPATSVIVMFVKKVL